VLISWEAPVPPALGSSHQCAALPIFNYEVLLENERQQQALTVSGRGSATRPRAPSNPLKIFA